MSKSMEIDGDDALDCTFCGNNLLTLQQVDLVFAKFVVEFLRFGRRTTNALDAAETFVLSQYRESLRPEILL